MVIKMKILLILLAILLVPAFVSAVLISEVYYDPILHQRGGEAIELFNPLNESVDISNYTISTKMSAQAVIIPHGFSIPANGYFLIGDEDFSIKKDNESIPEADYESKITLGNTNSGIALYYNEQMIDAVGWGNPDLIGEGFYIGIPSNGANKGYSIQRIQNTQDNSIDFISALPDLKNRFFGNNIEQYSNTISFLIQILDYNSYFSEIFIFDEDELEEGNQIIPNPGDKKIFLVNATIIDNHDNIQEVWVNLNERRFNLTLISNINNISKYQGEIEIDFYESPQNYTLTFMNLNNYNLTNSMNGTFTYLPMIALDIDTLNLECEIPQGQECKIKGDINMNTPNNTTIQNLGNTNLNFKITGTTPISENLSLPLNTIRYSFNSNFENMKNLTEEGNINEVNLNPGSYSVTPLSFSIKAPINSKEGNYISEILITGVEDE